MQMNTGKVRLQQNLALKNTWTLEEGTVPDVAEVVKIQPHHAQAEPTEGEVAPPTTDAFSLFFSIHLQTLPVFSVASC